MVERWLEKWLPIFLPSFNLIFCVLTIKMLHCAFCKAQTLGCFVDNDGQPYISLIPVKNPLHYRGDLVENSLEDFVKADGGGSLCFLPAGEEGERYHYGALAVVRGIGATHSSFVVIGCSKSFIRRWTLDVIDSADFLIYGCVAIAEVGNYGSSQVTSIVVSDDGWRSAACEGSCVVIRSDDLHPMSVLKAYSASGSPEIPTVACFEERGDRSLVVACYESGRVIGWITVSSSICFEVDSLSFGPSLVSIAQPSSGTAKLSQLTMLPIDESVDSSTFFCIGREDGRLWVLELLYSASVGSLARTRDCRERGSIDSTKFGSLALAIAKKGVPGSPSRTGAGTGAGGRGGKSSVAVGSPSSGIDAVVAMKRENPDRLLTITSIPDGSIVALTMRSVVLIDPLNMQVLGVSNLKSLFRGNVPTVSGCGALVVPSEAPSSKPSLRHRFGDDISSETPLLISLLSSFERKLRVSFCLPEPITAQMSSAIPYANPTPAPAAAAGGGGGGGHEVGCDDGTGESGLGSGFGKREALDFFPQIRDRDLPESSPLRLKLEAPLTQTMHLGFTGASASGASPHLGRGGWNLPRVEGGKIVDLPVTFQTKIKSSGYGQDPLSATAKGGRGPRRRTGNGTTQAQRRTSSAPESDAMGRRLRIYPTDCSPMATHQPQNDFSSPSAAGSDAAPIYDIQYSGDASFLAIATADTAVTSLRLPIGRHRGDGSNYMGHDGRVTSVSCSHAKGLLLSSSSDGSARMWMAGRSDSAAVTFSHRRHSPSTTGPTVNSVSVFAASNTMGGAMTSGSGAGASAKKAGAGTTKHSRNKPFGCEVQFARFFYQDEFVLLSARNTAFLYTYELGGVGDTKNDLKRMQSTGKYKLAHEWPLEANNITALSCMNSVRSHIVLAGTSDKNLVVLDAASGCISRVISSPHERAINCIALPTPSVHVQLPASAYNIFATSAADGTVGIWDLRAENCIARYSGHVNRRERIGIALSPCLRYIATGSEDKTARVIDLVSARQLAKLQGHRDVVSSVAFNPLFPQLATASYSGQIKFYVDPTFALSATATYG